MTYRNLKNIINNLPIDVWVIIDIEMSIDDFLKETLNRWLDLLQADGCNSKSMVMNDIQYLLKELKESER